MSKHPIDIQEELFSMPEWRRLAEIRHFNLSLKIFQRNAAELYRLIETFSSGHPAIKIWAIWNRPELEEFQIEVTRFLHNFVAAATSLIDHARRFYEVNYQKNRLFCDYEIQVKKLFAENQLCVFVKGLRNYCLHKGFPSVVSQLSYNKETGPLNKIFLTKKDLLGFGWPGLAMRYLESAPDQIDLQNIINEYAETVTEFYNWMFTRLEQIHTADRAAVKKKDAELKAAIIARIPSDLEAQLGLFEKAPFPPEQMFLQFIEPGIWKSICRSKSDPISVANTLIENLAKIAPDVYNFKDRILAAFKEFYKDKPRISQLY